MEDTAYQADLNKTLDLLKRCLDKQASADSLKWLEIKLKQINAEQGDAVYFMTFSTIPTYFDHAVLKLTPAEIKAADNIRKYWNPNGWSLAQTARTYLILSFAQLHPERFKDTLDKIFGAADLQELIALYQAMPLFPTPQKFLLHATNGIRSNMISVFEAIALNNPYPENYFNEIAWNQLVLKTLFVDSHIEKVIGLKQRANPTLAQALINTARERSAANRPIKIELWYLMGFSTQESTWTSLKDLLQEKNQVLKQGAVLACNFCQLPAAKELFNSSNEQHNLHQDVQKLRAFEQQLI